MKRFLLLIIACLISGFAAASDYAPLEKFAVAEMAHPRLILRSGDFDAVRRLVEQDSVAQRMHDQLVKRADRIMSLPVSERIQTGKRLLTVSRNVLERVTMWSYMYYYTGKHDYVARAEREMLAVSAFSDWNPSHFLDVGEMTAALAIGLDWLYDELPESSRATIAQAIAEKGLRAAELSKYWWYTGTNNWNSVCNAGLVMGAIAIADRYPELAKAHIAKSLKSNHLAMSSYGPDGVYPEGYGYWDYGTWFQVLMIESLRSAFGDADGLEKYPGFLESARFMDYMQSFDRRVYNFSDDGAAFDVSNPLLYWFAHETGDMSLVWNERIITSSVKNMRLGSRRLLPVAMLFMSRCDVSKIAPSENRCWSGQGEQPIFICRDKDFYLAAKGGSPSLPHAHMDGGSFVYEWGGVRWAAELGSQNYHSLEKDGVDLWNMKQASQRWDVFRLALDSHNTLMVNDKRLSVRGSAPMTATYTAPNRSGAQFDLSSLYFDLERAVRTVTVDAEGKLSVVDELKAGANDCRVRWTICTPAVPKVVSRTEIELQSGERKVLLRVVSPKGEVEPFVLPNTPRHSYEVDNKGSLRVGFYTNIPRGKAQSLKVEILPIE